MTEPATQTLEVAGATLAYDVREGDGPDAPVLLMIGSPMGATGFATLAGHFPGHFPDRTVVMLGVGAASDGELAHRAADAIAEQLGVEPVVFPGDHGGFLGGEYGQTGEPAAYAAKLRQVVSEAPA